MITPADSFDTMAQFAKHQTDQNTAEKFYRLALLLAESTFGKDSPQAGMVILSLQDIYDSQDRFQESKDAQARIRGILVKNAHLCHGPIDDPA